MKKEEIIDILGHNFQEKIVLSDIPEMDLYMDQVIQLFESKLSSTKRNEDDKVLTKTMINNYAKAKLLMSIKNKRYSKEHLILMSLIYELKGGLSINDIKSLLDDIVSKFENQQEYDLRSLYNLYLDNCKEDNEAIIDNIKTKIEKIEEDSFEDSFEDKFLLISSLISISNAYRRVGELLIDKYFVKKEEK